MQEIISLEKPLWPALARQMSLVYDLAYEQGKWIGYFLTFMPQGKNLLSFLFSAARNANARVQVAKNLCTIIILAKRQNVNIGRLSPQRIKIDPYTCRVFLCRSAVEGFDARNANEEPYDLFLHVYCLEKGESACNIEDLSWDKDDFSGDNQNFVTKRRIADNILNSTTRPFWVRVFAHMSFETPFQSSFWNEPEPLRRLYDIYTSYSLSKSMQEVASDFLSCFDNCSSKIVGKQARFQRLVTKNHMEEKLDKQTLKDNEQRINGIKGNGKSGVFWFVTLLTSFGIGICATINGFSPLEILIQSSSNIHLPETIKDVAWQYLPASIGGCAVFNIVLARKNCFRGYRRLTYCASIITAMIFMMLTKLLGVWLGGIA